MTGSGGFETESGGSVSLETWISGHFTVNQNGPEMHAVNELKLRLDNRVLIILHHST